MSLLRNEDVGQSEKKEKNLEQGLEAQNSRIAFINGYLSSEITLSRLYQKRAFKQLSPDELEEITILERSIEEGIEINHLPYMYKLSFDNLVQSRTLRDPVYMRSPVKITDKHGKSFLALNHNGELKLRDSEQETVVKKEYARVSGMMRTYEAGVRAIEHHFTLPINAADFNFSEEDIQTYSLFLSDSFQDILSNLFGKSLKEQVLPHENLFDSVEKKHKEGFYFFRFISTATKEEFENVETFSKKYGFEGLKTFLSLEHDRSLGEKIIELGNRIPEEVSRQIFAKYSELVDLTSGVAEYASQFQKNVVIGGNDNVEEISQNLLIRAKDVLISSMGKSPEDILSLLETVKADAELFKATLVIEKKRGGTPSLESLRDVEFVSRKSSELLPEEIASMRALYAANYAKKPELQKKLLESFDRSLENEKTVFYLFKFKGAIKGFCRFDDLGDGKKYFGSFNVDESMQGATLGESMIDQSVNVEADHCEIIADCHAANRIGARYIENGFVATDFVEDYYGIPVFSIIRNDPETAELFTTKQMDKDDLMTLVSHPRNDIRIYEEESQEALLPLFGDKVGKGHVLTRYFQDEVSKRWFAVLEVLRQ